MAVLCKRRTPSLTITEIVYYTYRQVVAQSSDVISWDAVSYHSREQGDIHHK
jgi:hypothetical protein